MSEPPPKRRPLVVGEVLFDHFPDGHKVLGGAPLNVAWNLTGLGIETTFLSAVGDDAEGKDVRKAMSQWGMQTRALQVSDKPTGRVSVTFNDGQPEYEIIEDVAFDHIRFPEFPVDDQSFSILCYGSLAYRSETSRRTIGDLVRRSSIDRFVDINIRDPFFDDQWLPVLLGDARWVKLSEGELSRLVGQPCENESQIETAVGILRDRYGINIVLVTCGSAGAYAIGEETRIHAAAAPIDDLSTTVGAGDAFAAATIAGLVREEPLETTLPSAVRFASRVCSLQGATTDDRSFYQS